MDVARVPLARESGSVSISPAASTIVEPYGSLATMRIASTVLLGYLHQLAISARRVTAGWSTSDIPQGLITG